MKRTVKSNTTSIPLEKAVVLSTDELGVLIHRIQLAIDRFAGKLNTPDTRLKFIKAINRIIKPIKPRLVDYRVVCDASNNPPSVLAENKLGYDIYIQWQNTPDFIHISSQRNPRIW